MVRTEVTFTLNASSTAALICILFASSATSKVYLFRAPSMVPFSVITGRRRTSYAFTLALLVRRARRFRVGSALPLIRRGLVVGQRLRQPSSTVGVRRPQRRRYRRGRGRRHRRARRLGDRRALRLRDH